MEEEGEDISPLILTCRCTRLRLAAAGTFPAAGREKQGRFAIGREWMPGRPQKEAVGWQNFKTILWWRNRFTG